MFSFLEMALSGSGEEEMKKAKEEAKENAKNLKKATCKIKNDEATCSFCCDVNNQPIVDSDLKLKKVKGKWYVHMSKEDMMNDQENLEEAPVDGQ
jgi:DNA-directed RNA polymerase specialized sigma54-like protein